MAQNSSESREDVDIKPVVNSQSHENAQVSIISNDLNGTSQTAINMKQDPKAESKELSLEISEIKPLSQNGTVDSTVSVVDPTRPSKTEGEATSGDSSISVSVVQCTPNTTPVVSTAAITTQAGTPSGNAAPDTSTSFGIFGAQGLSGMTSQMSLTPEEQSAAYRRANILALSALAKNGGPNAKEMLAVQQKLQEFLTSLISLAGQKGPELKIRVQQLVQNLVTGQVSEDDFANQIEKDLQSQHQPSLLPFLKSSVPHLKTRLQLQQAIMKELLQRQEREKSGSTPSTPSQLPPPISQPPSTVNQKPVKPVSTQGVSLTQTVTQFPTGSTVSKPIMIGAGLPVKNSTNTSPSGVQLVTPVGQIKSVTPQASPITTTGVSSNPNPTGATPSSGGIVLQPALIQQLSLQLPKNVRDQIAKLPPEQQKMVYLHHFKRLQMLRQQQLQARQNTSSPTNSSTINAVPNAQTVRARQEKLIKEQQVPLIMGNRGIKASNRQSLPQTQAVGATNSTLMSKDTGKSSFANMKLVPGGSPSTPGVSPSKGKKGKGKGKDVALDANEEEDEGMDILDEVGVNLQEESAQFLPTTEGTAGSVQDKAFLDVTLLRRKVGSIARQYGVGDVSDDYLSLLSHAAETRLRDVLEKLTQISQHRTEVLKDNSQYRVKTEVRGQLKVLETIDRIIDKRKTERENEQTLKAARSRSKGADPVKAAQIREEARQIQEDKAAIIRDQAANETALKAIGSRRKRPLPQSDQSGGVAGSPGSSTQAGATSSLFAPLSVTRAPKRHVTSRDLIFYLEQERETRKSLTLYKTLLK